MMEETVETPKNHKGWPKGKKRGPRKIASVPPTFLPAPEPEAPIHVRLRLKDYAEPIEFGCARRFVENGFHVFLYPSERDRYRETRREFAISEIIEIEITEARQQTEYNVFTPLAPIPPELANNTPRGPVIHSVKKHAEGLLGKLETSQGPIKMDTMPKISFGDDAG